MKKILSLALVAIITLSIVPSLSFAEQNELLLYSSSQKGAAFNYTKYIDLPKRNTPYVLDCMKENKITNSYGSTKKEIKETSLELKISEDEGNINIRPNTEKYCIVKPDSGEQAYAPDLPVGAQINFTNKKDISKSKNKQNILQFLKQNTQSSMQERATGLKKKYEKTSYREFPYVIVQYYNTNNGKKIVGEWYVGETKTKIYGIQFGPNEPVQYTRDQQPSDSELVDMTIKMNILDTFTKQIVTSENGTKTYTNTKLGFSFQYPSTWVKVDPDVSPINLQGAPLGSEISFKDTASDTTLLVKYTNAPQGTDAYNFSYADFINHKGWYTAGGAQLVLGGKNAIKATIVNDRDGRGNVLKPAQRKTIVDALDARNADVQLQLSTTSTDTVQTNQMFDQVLSSFKFTN